MNQPQIAAELHPAVTAYEKAISGIPDTFDYFTAKTIRDYVEWSDVPLSEADKKAKPYVRSFFTMLDTWRDALDELDSELRGHVVAGGLPKEHVLYLQLQALALFTATTGLQRAALEYHYGVAGPKLSEDYGHTYELSNSALSPFQTAANETTTTERAENARLREQAETLRVRLWLIDQTLQRVDASQDPAGIAGDLGPYLDGPLHAGHIAAYHAVQEA